MTNTSTVLQKGGLIGLAMLLIATGASLIEGGEASDQQTGLVLVCVGAGLIITREVLKFAGADLSLADELADQVTADDINELVAIVRELHTDHPELGSITLADLLDMYNEYHKFRDQVTERLKEVNVNTANNET